MYICVCNAVTDSDIRNAVDDGVSSLKQLKRTTGCANSCGCCREEATAVLQRALAQRRESRSLSPLMQIA
jgi:bacterioferritin-associated ferredoxin